MSERDADWEAVIGLEIHTQLNTRTKLFSRAPNRFGDEPNTNISAVCTGQPGALPVLNKEAVKKAVQLGCALGSSVALVSYFDRKSYFYPDNPRNFQITQFNKPILSGGEVEIELDGVVKTILIDRAHLEDDTGMLKHFSHFAGIDYNRAGTPLIEIVSTSCMRSAKEASAYAMALRRILLYLDISDCSMEESSIRMDANVSVRLKQETELRPKVEIKNMNSFHHMELAIEAEIRRQIRAYREGQDIKAGTYRFDLESKSTILMRKKEKAADYRYFPEPDLPPIVLTQNFIEKIKKELPELPKQRYLRYTGQLELPKDAAEQLINDKATADYFEKVLKDCPNARLLCNWLIVEFAGRLKESGQTLTSLQIPPSHIASLIRLIDSGKITGKIAKSVADQMLLQPGKDPATIVKENPDFTPISNEMIEPLVDEVLATNSESIRDYFAGKGRAFDFLVGQVMKLCKGKASPDLVNKLIQEKLKALGEKP